MVMYIKDEWVALDRDNTVVAHGEDYDRVVVEATSIAESGPIEIPSSRILIVRGSFIAKS